MKLVLNRTVFSRLCRILDARRNKFAERVSLIGRTAGERVVIEATGRTMEGVPGRRRLVELWE
jgi:hypothetical protein